jgi:tetratricopeptide (TPR) repeat protein
VLTVVGKRYGYQVGMDVASKTAGSPAEVTTVLVRVTSISGGVSLASRVFENADDEAAVRAGGLWAAGYILNRSSRIPSWAEWNADTASARVLADVGTDCTIDELKSALQQAPDSGLLLARLGHCYELEERRIDAIGCYARAVTAHPHYWVARYRLAAALGTMRHDAARWARQSDAGRRDGLRAVTPAIKALQVDAGDQLERLKTVTSAGQARAGFQDLALILFKALERDTRYSQRVLGALRRSERDLTWPSLVPPATTAGRRFHPLVKSARRSLGGRPQLAALRSSAARPQSSWQISYNAACGYASSTQPPPEPQPALDLLEQTLVRPDIHQLSAEWVEKDPALSSLAADPRFTRFVAQLRPGD